MDEIRTKFLCDGCQSSVDIANELASYISQAKQTIEISIYSFCLGEKTQPIIQAALDERAKAGVAIRIAYDAGSQLSQLPPTGQTGHYTCEQSTPEFINHMGFPSRQVEGDRALMHHKYVLLDAATPNAQVWTGSTNFTDESWTLQDNNIIVLRSQRLAGYYARDFEELWVDSNLTASGLQDSGEATLQYGGAPAYVLVNFSPGEGEWIDNSLSQQIERTNKRLTIATVVLTSSGIIRAIQGLMARNVPIEGVYDWTQMEGVKYQWSLVPENHWKIGVFEEIVQYGNLVGKKSTPFTPTSTHDFMHNKIMVADDTTITGSYNFSRHAQRNAENILLITSSALASTYRDYIGMLMRKYASQPKPAPSSPEAQQAEKTPPAPNT